MGPLRGQRRPEFKRNIRTQGNDHKSVGRSSFSPLLAHVIGNGMNGPMPVRRHIVDMYDAQTMA